ncbi:MAG: hypothetical protein ACI8TQ_001088 [Planctomycetota bacterium]|jgi:hypothetical protein
MNHIQTRSDCDEANRVEPPLAPDETWPKGPLYQPLFRFLLAGLRKLSSDLESSSNQLESDAGANHDDVELLTASHAHGWVFGVLGAAGGFDILFQRREPHGLSILIQSVRELLIEAGCALPESNTPLPNLDGEGSDWRLGWAISNSLFVANREEQLDSFHWSLSRTERIYSLEALAPAGAALIQFAQELELNLPGSHFQASGDSWSLKFDSNVRKHL